MSARHYALNPGELPIYDLTLHGWIALFGTSPTAMRALSAAFGVLTIALVYIVVCELFAPETETESVLTIDDIAINRRTRRDCLRRKPRHHQVLARGADVSDAARRDSRAARDIPPHAAHRRSRELRASRSSDRNFDSDELFCPSRPRSRGPVAAVCPRARGMETRECDRAPRMGARGRARRRRINPGAETSFAVARADHRRRRRARMAQAAGPGRAVRVLQQGDRQLRVSDPRQRSRFGARTADGAAAHTTLSASRCCGCGRRLS